MKALSAILLMAATFLCCCPFSSELVPAPFERAPVEIVGGYVIGRQRGEHLRLYAPPEPIYGGLDVTYPTVVYSEVVRIGWDQDFILVEQRPYESGSGATPDSSNPRWYIVVVSTHKVYSDLSYERFLSLREELAIPESIEMRSAHEVYAQNAE